MPTDHRAALASISRFDQLIAYLRDEMGWPITQDSLEDANDLFFDFTPEELGIDPRTAAKIESIKRLRPLSPRQPWGIFFVKFEPKRLPVVALRRILSQVALKKRASANKAEQAAWAVDDLLFISNFGEGDQRQISFAHFSQPRADELPTLKVLGWDNLDTALHLDQVAIGLTEQLAWPDDETDVAAWRENWRSAFQVGHGEVIRTSKELARRLAQLAQMIRDRVKATLTIETNDGPVRKLVQAFKEALIHDLTADQFADMYAQTIAYGLLSARITNQDTELRSGGAIRLPVTNPFLRELMESFLHPASGAGRGRHRRGVDFDELGIKDVVDLLDRANMEAVVRDFGDKNPQEDPVINFYEFFLAAYDKEQKVHRGVFYTPRPVVSYIVRSVDELLRTEFGLEDGLADTSSWGEMAQRHPDLAVPEGISPQDTFVQILDPATGTGTFLVEVIDLAHKTMLAKWASQGCDREEIAARWNEYVPTHLLTRLYAYELLMAPYAIAHLKVGLKLYETGYRFASEERARIYLTNALEPGTDWGQQSLAGFLPALAHEAQAVNHVKRTTAFTVIVGNPPYSFRSSNRSAFILGLLGDYRPTVLERKPQQNDDYVKFLRVSQYLLSSSPFAILGMITNNSYLYGVTHQRMRESLSSVFGQILITDLGGDTKFVVDGALDENVFDIRQGVCVGIFVRSPERNAEIGTIKLEGSRTEKYRAITETTAGQIVADRLPASHPLTFANLPSDAEADYGRWPRIVELMPTYINGVITSRDAFAVDTSAMRLRERLDDFASLPIQTLMNKYAHLDLRDNISVPIATAQMNIQLSPSKLQSSVVDCSYRPFDDRYIAFNRNLIHRTREVVMRHMLRENKGFVFNRSIRGDPPRHFFMVRHVVVKEIISSKDNSYVAPLYLYPEEDGGWQDALPRANFSDIAREWWRDHGPGGAFDAELFLAYLYGVVHSPTYRLRNAHALASDFPRVPLTSVPSLFRDLAALGTTLIEYHLLESQEPSQLTTSYQGASDPEVRRIGWADDTVWLDAAARPGQPNQAGTIGFRGVPQEVWDFHVGGYQVCEKWLKDRKGSRLSTDDIAHYQRIVGAISQTIRIMGEIDDVIDAYGGWPDAFQSGWTGTELRKVAEAGTTYVPDENPLDDGQG